MTLKKFSWLMILAASTNLTAMEFSHNHTENGVFEDTKKYELTKVNYDQAFAEIKKSLGDYLVEKLSSNLDHAIGQTFTLNEWRNEINKACQQTQDKNPILKNSSFNQVMIKMLIGALTNT